MTSSDTCGELVLALGELHYDKRTAAARGALHLALGAAAKVMGPEAFLKLLPIKASHPLFSPTLISPPPPPLRALSHSLPYVVTSLPAAASPILPLPSIPTVPPPPIKKLKT